MKITKWSIFVIVLLVVNVLSSVHEENFSAFVGWLSAAILYIEVILLRSETNEK